MKSIKMTSMPKSDLFIDRFMSEIFRDTVSSLQLADTNSKGWDHFLPTSFALLKFTLSLRYVKSFLFR